MPQLSVFIITKNEEAKIGRCIDAIAEIADEIVVLDSGSIDRTTDIARAKGARVETHPFNGYGEQKYRAEQLCTHDWVLNLDADEFATPKLREDIKAFMGQASLNTWDGARIKTVTVYPHKTKPRLWADYHNYIRLYNKAVLNFPSHPIFDAVIPKDARRIFQFKSYALHYSYKDLKALDLKARKWTRHHYVHDKRRPSLKNYLRLPFEFIFSFLKCYIGRRHFTGGLHGLGNAYIYARYRHLRLLQRIVKRALT